MFPLRSSVYPLRCPLVVQVHELDEKHDVSGKFVAVAMTAHAKAIEVDTK